MDSYAYEFQCFGHIPFGWWKGRPLDDILARRILRSFERVNVMIHWGAPEMWGPSDDGTGTCVPVSEDQGGDVFEKPMEVAG